MSGRDDAHDADEGSGPSLEPPSLFGRKRRRKPAPTPPEPVLAEPEPVAQPQPEPTVEVTRPVAVPPVSEPAPEPVRRPVVRDEPPTPEPVAPEPVAPEPAAPRRTLQLPRVTALAGRPGVALVGVLVGLFVVLATLATQGLCSAVRGTSSCGGGGFFLLVAILVVAAVAGGALLRAVGEPEPGSTALLAVALLSVVTLLFLAGHLFEWWMAIAIPLVSLAMFLVSHWVTTTFSDASGTADRT